LDLKLLIPSMNILRKIMQG